MKYVDNKIAYFNPTNSTYDLMDLKDTMTIDIEWLGKGVQGYVSATRGTVVLRLPNFSAKWLGIPSRLMLMWDFHKIGDKPLNTGSSGYRLTVDFGAVFKAWTVAFMHNAISPTNPWRHKAMMVLVGMLPNTWDIPSLTIQFDYQDWYDSSNNPESRQRANTTVHTWLESINEVPSIYVPDGWEEVCDCDLTEGDFFQPPFCLCFSV